MGSSDIVLLAGGLAVGMLLGGLLAWVLVRARSASERSTLSERLAARDASLVEMRQRVTEREERLEALQTEISVIREQSSELRVRLQEAQRASREKEALLQEAEQSLTDAFATASAEALDRNSRTFLEIARSAFGELAQAARVDLETRRQSVDASIVPIREALSRIDGSLQTLEQRRNGAEAKLREQLAGMSVEERRLREETARLVQALRTPSTQGRWGEMQLRRVVELAGMREHCDFETQTTLSSPEGRYRPDMVVHLPGGRQILVDAKTPLHAFLEAVSEPDSEIRAQRLQDHARRVREHVGELAKRAYEKLTPGPELVVMFLPGESFFASALAQDSKLIEDASARNVILASPTTLIALLRTVAYGWDQHRLNENVRAISEEGRALHQRIAQVVSHFEDLRKALQTAVEAYNRAAGSVERRLIPAARRFQELGAAGDRELGEPGPVDVRPRSSPPGLED